MSSDDLDLDTPASDEYPDDCARGLRKYLFVMAIVVVGTLAGTFWYRSLGPGAQVVGLAPGGQAVSAPALGGGVNGGFAGPGTGGFAGPGTGGFTGPGTGGFSLPGRPAAVLAAAAGVFPDFAAVVSSLRGTVVSVGRTRAEGRFGFGRGAAQGGGEGAPQAAAQAAAAVAQPGADGALQFAVPAAGAVLESIGTGFIVRNDGYILTNYHVVRGNDQMVVTVFDETGAQRYPATIVKLDASVDLALLKIEPRAPLMAVPLGDSDQTQVADEVIAIGSPFGLDLTVSRGIVSAKRKSLVIEGTVHRDLLQTDAAINQGNSGGPLVNRSGEVIGINTAIYTPTGAFAGVGFAVPSNQAKLFLSEELALQAGQGAAGGGLWGLPVAAAPGTMAGGGMAAGVAGPPILAGVASPHRDGRERMDCGICHQLLPRAGGAAMAGGGMARGVPAAAPPAMPAPPIVAGTPAPHRDGRETMDCAICHKFIPAGGAAAAPVALPGGGLQFARPPATLALNVAAPALAGAAPGGFLILGASVLPVTAALAAETGQAEGKGVFVAGVVPGSPAAEAGLVAGMVIEKVDGRRLRTPRDLFAVVEAAKTGDRLRLAVTGAQGRQELRLTVSVLAPAPGVAAPGAPAAPGAAAVPTEFNWRGMEIETFAAVTPAGTGGTVALKGAVIAEVVPGSPAARAGLQANDVILAVGGMPAGSAALINEAVKAATGKREVVMRMARSNREFFAVLP